MSFDSEPFFSNISSSFSEESFIESQEITAESKSYLPSANPFETEKKESTPKIISNVINLPKVQVCELESQEKAAVAKENVAIDIASDIFSNEEKLNKICESFIYLKAFGSLPLVCSLFEAPEYVNRTQ